MLIDFEKIGANFSKSAPFSSYSSFLKNSSNFDILKLAKTTNFPDNFVQFWMRIIFHSANFSKNASCPIYSKFLKKISSNFDIFKLKKMSDFSVNLGSIVWDANQLS